MTEWQTARLGTNCYSGVHKFDKNIAATSIFKARSGWHEAHSMLIQSSGVDCNPHCYLLCSCELLRTFVCEGKTVDTCSEIRPVRPHRAKFNRPALVHPRVMISFKLLSQNLLGVTEKISSGLGRSCQFSLKKKTFSFQNTKQECCSHHSDMTEQLIMAINVWTWVREMPSLNIGQDTSLRGLYFRGFRRIVHACTSVQSRTRAVWRLQPWKCGSSNSLLWHFRFLFQK